MGLLKQYLIGPIEAAVKARERLSNATNFYHEDALKSLSAIVQFVLKHHATDYKIVKLEAGVRRLRQRLMKSAEFSEELWTKKLSFGSVYDEKSIKIVSVKDATQSICQTISHWRAEHQYACPEDLTQRAESLLDLQGRPPPKKTTSAEYIKYRNEQRNTRTRKAYLLNMKRVYRRENAAVHQARHREVIFQQGSECRHAVLSLH